MKDRVAVVAGNGPSLAEIDPTCVISSDFFIRTNSFFLEPAYFLGDRIDLGVFAGDPRVTPFLFETLRKALDHYDLRAWTATTEKVARIGRTRLPLGDLPCRLDPASQAQIDTLSHIHGVVPTTGIKAMFLAEAMGAQQIILTGMDLYSGSSRYAFAPGRRMRALLGQDLATRGYDARLHDPDLDRRLIAWLAAKPGMQLWRAPSCIALADLLDPAPPRDGPRPRSGSKPEVTDWLGVSRGYPIALLKILREGRKLQRRALSWTANDRHYR